MNVNAPVPLEQVERAPRVRRGLTLRHYARLSVWVLGLPAALMALIYLILLITPIPLPFVRDQALTIVQDALPESANVELGDMSLALENYFFPVLKFSPVAYTDDKTGATIELEALEVGFSPWRALFGQPGATITIVGPHLQINQDLLGPRLTRFEVIDDPNGGRPTVRVIEGEDAFPSVNIEAGGLDVRGALPDSLSQGVRSDNDWLIYNLEAAALSLRDVILQAEQGRFSRMVIRDGLLDMNDAVYGLLRQFQDITLDVAPNLDGQSINGDFSASLGGRVMHGSLTLDEAPGGTSRLTASVTNIDFAAVLPFIDDPDSMASLNGAGALSIDVGFDSNGKVLGGQFNVDLTGTDLRIEENYFPVVSSIMKIDWSPDEAKFSIDNAELRIGQSSGTMSGVFKLGLDDLFGPTIGMSIKAKDVFLHPNDMAAPETPFTDVEFNGWSAPLYGALGIDQMVVSKPGARLATAGRIDMLRAGMGFDLTIGGEGISADDLKRLWPYIFSEESREWFVANVNTGAVQRSQMKFSYPVGTVPKKGEDKPIPQNGIYIDMVGVGVSVKATDTMAPIAIEGEARLQMRDEELTISADGATIATGGGNIDFANAALVMGDGEAGKDLIEISGDVAGGIPALVALAREQQPGAIEDSKLPIDVGALDGKVAVTLVSTILLSKDGTPPKVDFALNGTVSDFGSTAPIQEHSISEGQLAFTASQAGYRVTGQAKVDGLTADVQLDGTLDGAPNMVLSSTIDTADLAKMGFDASDFLSGQVKFAARPMPDGSIQMVVDIKDAALTIKDLGISKAKGVDGQLQAAIKQAGTLTELSQINLAFGDVALQGSLGFDSEKGLQSAEFSNFALSAGDQAQASLTPIRDGFALRLRGDQLDLKPMLQRFFNLGEGSGGPQATQFTQTIALDVELKRAVGFYKTTAYNVDLDMTLRGSDLQRVNLTAQLGENNSISVTTNPTPDGRTMSVAFNDLGTLLRLVGVYARVEGGNGTLVLATNTKAKTDVGAMLLRDFALIDEANVAQVLGNHQGSRELIARQNKLAFKSARVDFVRKPDRIEVSEGILTGNTVGGTMRGFIYTETNQYDLTGTYVPLFGLNSAFQKLPLFGPLLGGRDGEGLIGVTFAVRGPLSNPDFKINPVSALVPGAFRSLFEFRAKEMPDAQ